MKKDQICDRRLSKIELRRRFFFFIAGLPYGIFRLMANGSPLEDGGRHDSLYPVMRQPAQCSLAMQFALSNVKIVEIVRI